MEDYSLEAGEKTRIAYNPNCTQSFREIKVPLESYGSQCPTYFSTSMNTLSILAHKLTPQVFGFLDYYYLYVCWNKLGEVPPGHQTAQWEQWAAGNNNAEVR